MYLLIHAHSCPLCLILVNYKIDFHKRIVLNNQNCVSVTMHAKGFTHIVLRFLLTYIMPVYRTCPAGFLLRKLSKDHADIVAPYWQAEVDIRAKQSLFRVLIKYFHSVGLFTTDEPNTPVAWCMQYPNGHLSHLYVTEPFRRKGFASLLILHMCKYIQEDGLLPEASVLDPGVVDLFKKIGFIEHCRDVTLIIKA